MSHIVHVNLAKGFRGGERQTALLIMALAKRGVRQTLICRYDSPLLSQLDTVSNLTLRPIRKPYLLYLFTKRYSDGAIFHAHEAKAAQWVYLNHCLYKTPYVITRRVPKPPNDVWFTRAVYRNAAKIVALSSAIEKNIQLTVPNLSVTVIPSMYASLSVDDRSLLSLRESYKDQFVIGHIGALVDKHKGQSVLIDAVHLLVERYPNFKVLLLGTGSDEAILKARAANLPNIEFLGFKEDIGTYIKLFDLFVFPSFEEGLGSTLLDVMQHQKPIIASGVDGILDLIEHDKNGQLVIAGDAKALASAIEDLYLSAEKRDRYVAANSEKIQAYSPDNIGQCYYALYETVTEA